MGLLSLITEHRWGVYLQVYGCSFPPNRLHLEILFLSVKRLSVTTWKKATLVSLSYPLASSHCQFFMPFVFLIEQDLREGLVYKG